jgi:serine/threonine protein phosphatase 1
MTPAGSVFVIGDVHGCLHTLAELLKQWDYQHETLVQVGDLINGGAWSPEVVALMRRLQQQYGSNRVVVLLGNHEQSAIEYFEHQARTDWVLHGGAAVINAYARRGYSLATDVEWFRRLPLFWENKSVFISHAGVSTTDDPYNPVNPQGVVWYRGPLQNIGILQVVGHVPVDEPTYSRTEHCWRIDTNARRGQKLSALRLDAEGQVLESISIPVLPVDLDRSGH